MDTREKNPPEVRSSPREGTWKLLHVKGFGKNSVQTLRRQAETPPANDRSPMGQQTFWFSIWGQTGKLDL
jgi:hypothetical protein